MSDRANVSIDPAFARELPEGDRRLVTLYYVVDAPMTDIAQELGLSLDQLEGRLREIGEVEYHIEWTPEGPLTRIRPKGRTDKSRPAAG